MVGPRLFDPVPGVETYLATSISFLSTIQQAQKKKKKKKKEKKKSHTF